MNDLASTPRYTARVWLNAALALLASTSLFAQSKETARTPTLPAGCSAIAAPAGNAVSLHVYALGVQVYRWNSTTQKWDFVAPIAVLYADAGYQAQVGTHFAGPTWMSVSGSSVVASRVDGCTPDATAIPWLLLKASAITGPGPLARTTFIQRVNTTGGLAPNRIGAPDEVVQVPYTAEYVFYRAK